MQVMKRCETKHARQAEAVSSDGEIEMVRPTASSRTRSAESLHLATGLRYSQQGCRFGGESAYGTPSSCLVLGLRS
jgi:hypothetical protein